MRREVRVRTVTRRLIRLDFATHAPCASCGREVTALTRAEACGVLQLGDEELAALLASGRVHEIATAGGIPRICHESLFPTSPTPPETGSSR